MLELRAHRTAEFEDTSPVATPEGSVRREETSPECREAALPERPGAAPADAGTVTCW